MIYTIELDESQLDRIIKALSKVGEHGLADMLFDNKIISDNEQDDDYNDDEDE